MRTYPTSGMAVSRNQNIKHVIVLDCWQLDTSFIRDRDAKRKARREARDYRQAVKLRTSGKIRLR